MSDRTAASSVDTVVLGAALAAFADGASTPVGAAAEAIAAAAAGWLRERFGRPAPVLFARQEHTRITYVYGAERPLAGGPHCVGTCDALLTAEPGTALLVRTADCLPVALAGGGVAAIVHAGWRGLAADILGATVARMASDFGVDAADVDAVVGVGVGPCHYRVGPEVVEGLGRNRNGSSTWQHGDAVDLADYAAGRLATLGLDRGRITVLPGCTACLPRYHSHRRDGARSGRQWSLVVLRDRQ